jgi:hypothetical protein
MTLHATIPSQVRLSGVGRCSIARPTRCRGAAPRRSQRGLRRRLCKGASHRRLRTRRQVFRWVGCDAISDSKGDSVKQGTVLSAATTGTSPNHMLQAAVLLPRSTASQQSTRTAAPHAAGAGHVRPGHMPRTRGGGSDYADDSASDMDADEGQGQTQAPLPQQPPFHTLLQAAALGSQGTAESPVRSLVHTSPCPTFTGWSSTSSCSPCHSLPDDSQYNACS